MNNRGDKGSPCLRSLELEKKPEGLLIIKIEKQTVDMQKEIHFLHLVGNLIFSRISKRKFQETWSYAFSKSSLQRIPKFPDLIQEFI